MTAVPAVPADIGIKAVFLLQADRKTAFEAYPWLNEGKNFKFLLPRQGDGFSARPTGPARKRGINQHEKRDPHNHDPTAGPRHNPQPPRPTVAGTEEQIMSKLLDKTSVSEVAKPQSTDKMSVSA